MAAAIDPDSSIDDDMLDKFLDELADEEHPLRACDGSYAGPSRPIFRPNKRKSPSREFMPLEEEETPEWTVGDSFYSVLQPDKDGLTQTGYDILIADARRGKIPMFSNFNQQVTLSGDDLPGPPAKTRIRPEDFERVNPRGPVTPHWSLFPGCADDVAFEVAREAEMISKIPDINPLVPRHRGTWYWMFKAKPQEPDRNEYIMPISMDEIEGHMPLPLAWNGITCPRSRARMMQINLGDQAFFYYPVRGPLLGISSILDVVKEASPDYATDPTGELGHVKIYVKLNARWPVPITPQVVHSMMRYCPPIRALPCLVDSSLVTEVLPEAWDILHRIAIRTTHLHTFATYQGTARVM